MAKQQSNPKPKSGQTTQKIAPKTAKTQGHLKTPNPSDKKYKPIPNNGTKPVPEKDTKLGLHDALVALKKEMEKAFSIEQLPTSNDFYTNLENNRKEIKDCFEKLNVQFTRAEIATIAADLAKTVKKADAETIFARDFEPHSITTLVIHTLAEEAGKASEVKAKFLESRFLGDAIAERNQHELGNIDQYDAAKIVPLTAIHKNLLAELFDKLTEGDKSRNIIEGRYKNKKTAAIKAIKDSIIENPAPAPLAAGATYDSLDKVLKALRAELQTSLPPGNSEAAKSMHDSLKNAAGIKTCFKGVTDINLTQKQLDNIVLEVLVAAEESDKLTGEFGKHGLTIAAIHAIAAESGHKEAVTKNLVDSPFISKTEIIEKVDTSAKPKTDDKSTDKKTAFAKGSTVTWIAAITLGIAAVTDFFGIGTAKDESVKEGTPANKEGEKPKEEPSWLSPRNILRALVLGGAVFLAVQASRGKPIGLNTANLLSRSPDTERGR